MWSMYLTYRNTYNCDGCPCMEYDAMHRCTHNALLHLRDKIDRVFTGRIRCTHISEGPGRSTIELIDRDDRCTVHHTIELSAAEAATNHTFEIYVTPRRSVCGMDMDM